MALTEANKAEWEKSLREIGLLEEDDCIEEHIKGDYWQFMSQTRGNYFLTGKKLIFVSGFGFESFAIKYSDIRELKKCLINFFLPTGVMVTAYDAEKGKDKKYRCSIMKRTAWMENLAKRAGISC